MKNNKIIIIVISISAIIIISLILFSIFKSDKLPFENDLWVRETDEVSEILKLNKDRTFEFITTVEDKNKLNECTEYKYDDKSRTIKLKCSKKAKITEIKIIESSEKELVVKIGKKKYTYEPGER